MMKEYPKVSLVMKVYNGEKYLAEAIDSILNQTFEDFELLIIDDGSTDSSAQIVRSYTDDRIRFLQNEENLGLCRTQNKVIAEARGEYIAVMDCDDISYPQRFEKQVHYLEEHPEVMMCGSYRNNIIDGHETAFQQIREYTNESLQFSLYFGNLFFTHSSIMFRAVQYREAGLSYGQAAIAEDYGIIIEMAKRYPVMLLPERLIAYRIYHTSTSKVRAQELADAATDLKCRHLESLSVSEKYKENLISYFRSGTAEMTVTEFVEAMQAVADAVGADISPQGNAYPIARDLFAKFLMRIPRYDMRVWKEAKHSGFQEMASPFHLFGIKLLGACMLHYKRK